MIIAKEKYKGNYIVYIDNSKDAEYTFMMAHRAHYIMRFPFTDMAANRILELLHQNYYPAALCRSEI